jgi:hypothetical protein
VIDVDEWAEIVGCIGRRAWGSRRSPAGWAWLGTRCVWRCGAEGPPRYARAAKGSIVDAVEAHVIELLREFPAMPAMVIAERIGWERSIRVLRDGVAELRLLFMPPDPCQRTTYFPGELAEFDLWQPDVDIPLGHGQVDKVWVIAGVCGFSRFLGGWMIPTRQAHDVLAGHLEVLGQFGALPRRVVWDQEGAIGQWHGGKVVFSPAFESFRGTLGIGAQLCRREDPEAKGLIERANGYFETSFLHGRRFESVADFNAQFTGWLRRVDQRIHDITKVRPAEAFVVASSSESADAVGGSINPCRPRQPPRSWNSSPTVESQLIGGQMPRDLAAPARDPTTQTPMVTTGAPGVGSWSSVIGPTYGPGAGRIAAAAASRWATLLVDGPVDDRWTGT